MRKSIIKIFWYFELNFTVQRMVEIWKKNGKILKNEVINLFIVNQLIIIHLETEKKYYQDILIFRIEFYNSINGGNMEERMVEIWKKMVLSIYLVNESIIIHLQIEKKYYQDILIFRVEFHNSINGGKNDGNLKKNGKI